MWGISGWIDLIKTQFNLLPTSSYLKAILEMMREALADTIVTDSVKSHARIVFITSYRICCV